MAVSFDRLTGLARITNDNLLRGNERPHTCRECVDVEGTIPIVLLQKLHQVERREVTSRVIQKPYKIVAF